LAEAFNVLIDPRVAEDGVTVADLREQFGHNMRMQELVKSVNRIADRVKNIQIKLINVSATDGDTSDRVKAIAARIFTEPGPYGKPGLQEQINYLAGMTDGVDQKVGRDALERYKILRQQLNEIQAEFENVIVPAPMKSGARARRQKLTG
jgi:hypothetical protein